MTGSPPIGLLELGWIAENPVIIFPERHEMMQSEGHRSSRGLLVARGVLPTSRMPDTISVRIPSAKAVKTCTHRLFRGGGIVDILKIHRWAVLNKECHFEVTRTTAPWPQPA
jgi:hypothetical protein